jgi:hypothetical protein
LVGEEEAQRRQKSFPNSHDKEFPIGCFIKLLLLFLYVTLLQLGQEGDMPQRPHRKGEKEISSPSPASVARHIPTPMGCGDGHGHIFS